MASAPPDQETLLSRAGLGDREAFHRLYEATSAKVFALGIRMLGDRAQAEDLVQDVYLKAWYRAGDYRPERGEPLAWLMTMARNRAIDMGRGTYSRHTALDDLEELEAVGQPDAPEPEHDAKLYRCLRELDASQRQCVFCAYFHGLSHGEVAKRFSEPVGTIKTRIRRGLASLKQCMQR